MYEGRLRREYIRYVEGLSCLWRFDFRLNPIFDIAPGDDAIKKFTPSLRIPYLGV